MESPAGQGGAFVSVSKLAPGRVPDTAAKLLMPALIAMRWPIMVRHIGADALAMLAVATMTGGAS
ncbi:MAG: hypothetical protein DI537_59230 [Stutzerimonas stutzeri]|nr:MAG: hypothetical protein DI537_59230 [Stutzerimonas stutzeri]